MRISVAERRLLISALEYRASRLEAMARRNKHGRKNDAEAAAMRRLRVRLFDLQPTNIEEEDRCSIE